MTEPYLRILDSRGGRIPLKAYISSSGDHEGAAGGRRMSTWGTSTSGPNTAIYGSLSSLRSRSRELIRNNPLIDGAADDYAANIIGSGIAPRWLINDLAMKQAIQDLWNESIDEFDYDGICDAYGQQTLMGDALIDAGEFLIKIIPRRSTDGLAVPIQYQLLEADHLDHTYNSFAPNGNEIRMGIEIDKVGKRVAYWLWPEHPGESFLSFRRISIRVRIPAFNAPDAMGGGIIHVFKPRRIGQMRGTPWLRSIIVKMHELDQYDDAELVRKKGAALLGSGYITEPIGGQIDPADYFGQRSDADSQGRDVIALEPGTYPILPRGMEPKFPNPPDVGNSYAPWKQDHYRQAAKGMGVTYEQFTGDLSNTSYSSIRAGLLEFRRRVKQIQFQTIVFQACRPMVHAWLDAAVLAGRLPISPVDYLANIREFRHIEWRPDGFPWVDPVKDQVAEQMARRNGFKSRAQIISETFGGDIDIVDREIIEENDRADRDGLVYDTDSRKTAQSGSIQKAIDGAVNPTAGG